MTATTDLIGHWRLHSFVEFDEEGNPKESPLGGSPRGSLYYGADGYVSVHIMRTDSAPPPAASYIGYTGRWRLAGDQVVHEVRIATDPTWPGSEQVRDFSLDGDELVLGRTDTVDGEPLRARLVWHRG
ncbi:lipocalin-like protein [Saccharopolyspora erythraea NRRL 2338]|uniref:Lipocalin-like domain-containing protein n=2 Tax=Saccharopolyspora erythraea TaxID=1836 RepID=A4FDN3_SACEN|nr:lipocalin-like domain-containing protein [Saccharopolyspora erythraea]EQD85708.1 hypothetical protein N599_13460 [Saccharopolyspora erythraea D]PFG95893.1 lipocalin-like protein [Saccharopolyspora erythraea NRRL 2338]QRK92466.1 lipocalin-like domain-containing protein [Saccharopolyspora erythraea]CAM02158.1 hypothetical protein SACE_2880 [Saccharopolyspora erythraea NRRL 2338]